MLQCVAGAVDARALAVPHAEYAIDGAVRIGLDLLGAEDGGCREIFVDGRQELDIALLEPGFGTPEFLVERAERRATIAADVTGRVAPCGAVECTLHQQDAHQCLCAGQEDAPVVAGVAVFQAIVIENLGHPDSFS